MATKADLMAIRAYVAYECKRNKKRAEEVHKRLMHDIDKDYLLTNECAFMGLKDQLTDEEQNWLRVRILENQDDV